MMMMMNSVLDLDVCMSTNIPEYGHVAVSATII